MLAHTILASAIAVFSMHGIAQITKGGGSERQENRQSNSTQRANPSGSPMIESQKPQSKDAAQGRAATADKNHSPDGSGGFGNGLYGIGAGSNK
ncbi:hypothetical protein BKIR_c3_2213 [Candidatus Paraburkholderia kirkii UZHbot1]|uniref:Beta-xylosidase n=1 Tax=Candidatus Paraburkholderia kirkii UZHbot1 TaxID=1055526 RepID=G4MBA5_9BURK|nr:hypothetical protein BKIR_c3_2213 [Candidatus Paraburkholderia kirkii UZHbot1]